MSFQKMVGIILLIYFIYQLCKHRTDLMYLIIYFLFPSKFVDKSTEEAINCELKGNNEGFKKQYRNDEKWKEARIFEYNKQFSESSNKLRKSIFQAFFTIIRVLLFSYGAAYVSVGNISLGIGGTLIIQIFSASLILWAFVGKLGWSLQTYKGESLPERINDFWCMILNISGVFLLFSALFYSLLNKYA